MPLGSEVHALMSFGLTETQARAYLCLNSLGTSDAKSLSRDSKISRQDIYRILDELFDIGLVQKVLAKPAEFRAISLDQCLKMLAHRRNEETKKLYGESIKILDSFCPVVRPEKDEPQTLLVSPREPVLLKAGELISSLKDNLSVLTPPQKLFPWIFAQEKLFERALRRGVKFRFITMKTDEALPKFLSNSRKGSMLEIQFVPELPSVSFGIYDDRRVILELSAETRFLESQVFVSDNPCLVELASVCFESVWGR